MVLFHEWSIVNGSRTFRRAYHCCGQSASNQETAALRNASALVRVLFSVGIPAGQAEYTTPSRKAPAKQKNHRPKSMVLFCGWRMIHPGLHFSSAREFPKCSCWSMPAPNPARNEYGKLEVVNYSLRTAISSSPSISPVSSKPKERYI